LFRQETGRMNQKELKELIEFLIEKDVAEFSMERGDVKVHIKRNVAVQMVAAAPVPVVYAPAPTGHANAPAAAGGAAEAPAKAPVEEEGLHIVKSPIVGTFYEAPSPGSPPFVKVGDSVDANGVLCIIEAMKLMNEIESEVAGEVVKKLVNNGQPVEYGQPLFAIRAR
jgi:acetyl-CoA carboxylase biotin carboxyl carrier protein